MQLAVGKGRILHAIECSRRWHEFLKDMHQIQQRRVQPIERDVRPFQIMGLPHHREVIGRARRNELLLMESNFRSLLDVFVFVLRWYQQFPVQPLATQLDAEWQTLRR